MEQKRETWEEIEALVQEADADRLEDYLATLSSTDIARAASRLDEEDQAGLLTVLDPESAADLIEELSDTQGADLIEELAPSKAAAIIDEMESDHRVDVLGEMDEDDAAAILERMDPQEAEEARTLLRYPEDTAGGIMVTEYLSYPMGLTVADVVLDLRENAERYSDYGVQYAYVVSESGTVVGVVRLRDLVLAQDNAALTSVMIANPLYVHVDTSLDELDQFFDRYPFVGVPVTDPQGRLVGVVRRADVEEAYGERAEQALMRFGGIIGGEELRDMSTMSRSVRRLAWLAVNLCLSLVAASVILHFEDTIQKEIALVFFIPVIANMSGCSGNQAVAVSIRELAMGLIQPQDFLRVWLKEVRVALLIGLAMGIGIAGIAYFTHGSAILGIVVGSALTINTLVALSLGGVVPLVLRRLGTDPALAAPLVVTTLADMCGFFLILALATFFVTRHML